MKVYTAYKDADLIAHVYLWGLDVTGKGTKAAVWLGTTKWGLGYVDVLNLCGPVTNLRTRRLYGLVFIKFKEAQK